MSTHQPSTVPKAIRALDAVIFRVAHLADAISGFICVFLIVVTTAATVVYQLGIAIAWLDDVLRLLIIWLVYMGCVSLCLNNDHIYMDGFYVRMPKPVRKAMDIFIASLGMAVCGYVAYHGYQSTAREIAFGQMLPSSYVPSWVQSLAIPFCFGLMTVAYVSFLFSIFTGRKHRHIGEEDKMREGL